MTNNELTQKFIEIDMTVQNALDKKCALKALEEDYKTTDFSKSFPEYTIMDAYDVYYKEAVDLGMVLKNFLNDKVPGILLALVEKLDLGAMFNKLDPKLLELMTLIAQDNDIEI